MADWRDQSWSFWQRERANNATARAERAEAAIQRVRALREQWLDGDQAWMWVAGREILAALDSTDPVEAAPKDVPLEPHGRVRDRLGRQWRRDPDVEFWCHVDESLRHFHRTWSELVAEFGPLVSTQPDTPAPGLVVRCSCDDCVHQQAAGLPVDGEERK